jgi:hypothetical protein
MRVTGLLVSGLLVAGAVSTSAYACSCLATDAETLMREGHSVVSVLITDAQVSDPNLGTLALTADVLQSFSGALPSDQIVLSTAAESVSCGYPIEVGQTAAVVLHPIVEDDAKPDTYAINLCTSAPVDDDAAADVLQQFADLREAGEGTWLDVIAFQQVLATNPDPETLREAFPEILVVLPGDIATREMRFDQSRFFARLGEDGRIYGGDFR